VLKTVPRAGTADLAEIRSAPEAAYAAPVKNVLSAPDTRPGADGVSRWPLLWLSSVPSVVVRVPVPRGVLWAYGLDAQSDSMGRLPSRWGGQRGWIQPG